VKKTNNLLDYIEWRGDLSFDVSPFNDIDSLLLSIFSYIDYSVIIPDADAHDDISDGAVKFSDVMERIEQFYPDRMYLGVIVTDEIIKAAILASQTVRYGGMYVNCYENIVDENTNIQFSATSFILPDKTVFISYRGTDDNIIGWKEDFYMTFETPVPSQIKALEYLDKIAGKTDMPFRLGGHSKGGNLAVWSAVKSLPMIQKRIINAYNYDGPGFPHDFYETEECHAISDRLVKIIPDSSVVGLMLEEGDYYKVIKSTEKKFYQHNPFSWEIKGVGFVPADSISEFSKKSDLVLKQWLATLTKEERREFVDIVFDAIASSNAKTLTDINTSRMKSAASVAHSMRELDKESRKKLIAVLRRLISFV